MADSSDDLQTTIDTIYDKNNQIHGNLSIKKTKSISGFKE